MFGIGHPVSRGFENCNHIRCRQPSQMGDTLLQKSTQPMMDCPIFWRSDWDASVLTAEAIPIAAESADAFDITAFRRFATILQCQDASEHLLLSDGMRRIQLEIKRGTLLQGQVKLHYDLSGLDGLEAKMMTLRRLVLLCRHGRFPNGLFPPERRALRWAQMLQAYDGASAGAAYRDIACALFGEETVTEDWGGRSDYLRLRVQRLVRSATDLVNGGYRHLLR